MPYLYYQLKITSSYNPEIYRIVEICGDRTFAELSDCILDAFEFDKSHLYLFSLKRKPYDPDGIYHPAADHRRRADQTRLQDVKPVVRNKYLYLYDFGDDWMFYITVQKIRESGREIPVKLIGGQGDLCQYPDWEDDQADEWDIEESCCNEPDHGENDDADDGTEDGAMGLGTLVITLAEEDDSIVRENLMSIPALLQRLWIRLVKEELEAVGDKEMELLHRLEKAGLVEVNENGTDLYLSVKKGSTDDKNDKIWDDFQKRCDLEYWLLSMVGIYGVIEKDALYKCLCEREIIPVWSREQFEETVEKLIKWGFWNRLTGADGAAYISSFCDEIAKEILQKREAYPVKWYCSFDQDTEDFLLAGDWKEAFPIYGETCQYLFWERGWHPEDVGSFLEQLIKCVAMGYSEQEYLTWIEEALSENQIAFTKTMRKVFLKFRREFPSAALKGYTWGEYEKSGRKDGYRQLSLFEEELPFQ